MTTRQFMRLADRPPLPDRPVSTRHAGALGWTQAAQRHAVDRGTAERLRRGVLVRTDDVDPVAGEYSREEQRVLLRARGATVSCPRAAVSHSAAGVAWRVPILRAGLRTCVTVPAGTALRSLVDVHLHRATVLDDEVVDCGGFRTLVPARTVLDIAREQGLEAGVVAADHALHHRLVTEDQLGAAYERCAQWPGRRAARLTVLLADRRAESPLESVSRLRLLAAHLPPPRPQAVIGDRFGRFIARCDFYWDEYGVVGEADGVSKYRQGEETPVSRHRRHELLRDTGLQLVRWGWADLPVFEPTADRVRRAFVDGARPGAPRRTWTVLPDRP